MLYCSEEDVKQYILDDYLQAAESYNAGIVQASMENASNEIYERLQGKYLSGHTPAIIRRICAVIAGYRIICAITSMVKSEAGVDNEFLPLQRLYNESVELLEKIAEGKISIGNSNDEIEHEVYSNGMAVVTPKREFDLKGY